MSLFEPFRTLLRPGINSNPWYFAGKRSSFPDIDPSSTSTLSGTIPCPSESHLESRAESPAVSVCKIVQTDSSHPDILTPSEALSTGSLDKQVLVFQYRDKIHAIDHQCPHNSFPLSRGRIDDIEDFGIVLSAEITCPKHGWAFDLFTGQSDRGAYKLGIWEVELRPAFDGTRDEEVWVRKKVKPRQG